MANQQARSSGVEVAPLLIIGILTLVALTLWLWRGTQLQTAIRPAALLVQPAANSGALHTNSGKNDSTGQIGRLGRVPGGSGEPTAPKPAAPRARAGQSPLRVPTLPEGVVGSHWRERKGKAVLLRPDNSRLGLTLDPIVQRRIKRRLKRTRVPYGAAVLMDVRSGAIRAWVEHQEPGTQVAEGHGLTRALAPAASIFKIVTAAALLEAGAQPGTETCFHGGHGGISRRLLKDSAKDTQCESLAMSLARSSNVAFGKQAVRRLSSSALTATAEDLFFGRALPFDVQAAPSWVRIRRDKLSLAKAAAGFVGTTLSPLHGAALAAAVANGGVLMRPFLVESDSLQPGKRRQSSAIGRVMSGAVARDLREMLALTLTDGTGRKQFKSWPKTLSHVQVAGKTGTLSRTIDGVVHYYTWFVGFAPAEDPQIAVAALAVNIGGWRIRGPSLARHALASWFLTHHVTQQGAKR